MPETRIADVVVETPEGATLGDVKEYARHLARSENGLEFPEFVDYLVVRRVSHNDKVGPPDGVWFDRWTLIFSDPLPEATASDEGDVCVSCGSIAHPQVLAPRGGSCARCRPALEGAGR
jgi:hypothetical protein